MTVICRGADRRAYSIRSNLVSLLLLVCLTKSSYAFSSLSSIPRSSNGRIIHHEYNRIRHNYFYTSSSSSFRRKGRQPSLSLLRVIQRDEIEADAKAKKEEAIAQSKKKKKKTEERECLICEERAPSRLATKKSSKQSTIGGNGQQLNVQGDQQVKNDGDGDGDGDDGDLFLLPGTEIIESILTEPFVELTICVLVLLSSLLVAIGTVPTLPLFAATADQFALDAIGYIFALEFALRWYSTGQLTVSYLARPLSLIDGLVVILPLVIGKVAIPLLKTAAVASAGTSGDTGLAVQIYNLIPPWLLTESGLVNLLLLRILRLQRILEDVDTFAKFSVALGIQPTEVRPYQLAIARVVLSIFTLLSVSTGLIYTAEHTVNPLIPDYFTALYFGLTTLTTVGFGDITPVTFQGRLVVSGSILAGVTIIPAQAASLVEALLDYDKEKQERKKKLSALENSSGGGGDEAANDNNINNRVVIEGIDNFDSSNPPSWYKGKACPSCGELSTRPDANFCQMCGYKFAKSAP